MARPMTSEQKSATEAAKALAETKERKAHMVEAQAKLPTNRTPIDLPLTPPTE